MTKIFTNLFHSLHPNFLPHFVFYPTQINNYFKHKEIYSKNWPNHFSASGIPFATYVSRRR